MYHDLACLDLSHLPRLDLPSLHLSPLDFRSFDVVFLPRYLQRQMVCKTADEAAETGILVSFSKMSRTAEIDEKEKECVCSDEEVGKECAGLYTEENGGRHACGKRGEQEDRDGNGKASLL